MIRITIKKGKGVLGKDKKPYVPRTIHVIDGEWVSPIPFTITALLNAITDEAVSQIEVIDENNVKTTLEIWR